MLSLVFIHAGLRPAFMKFCNILKNITQFLCSCDQFGEYRFEYFWKRCVTWPGLLAHHMAY